MNPIPEVDVHVSLTRRVFLLAYSPERRRLSSRERLGVTLQAAALYELYAQGLIRDHTGKVTATAVRGRAPDCDLAADMLARITASERAHSWGYWVRKGERQATDRVGATLERERVIRFEPHRLLGIVPTRRMLLRQPRLRAAATKAVCDALKATRPVDRVPAVDAALVALTYEGELRVVLGRRERRAARGRVDALEAGLGPVPEALRKAVRRQKSRAAGAAG
ncbi:GPP34 family phosphoprotein [Embleya sp. NPDC059259]|uniref:GOLPH3/VPS74 family protein n=1 Tax=unclassified Embleya TaxID=2699296 RepID=UPI0036C70CBE